MSHPRDHARGATSLGAATSFVLGVAFALSAAHTVYSYIAGIGDPRFTVTTPVAYVFYAVGFASTALARHRARWSQWVLLAYLTVLLYVAIFWYPTTFTQRQQTVFGWFENDVYTGFLLIATYLVVQRLRGRHLTPGVGRTVRRSAFDESSDDRRWTTTGYGR